MDSAARPPSGQYYWGRQWTVRPNIGAQSSKAVQQSRARIAGVGMTNPIERAGAEIPVQSWPEWVEEWQALQGASGDLESQKVEDRGAAYQSIDITDAAADPLLGRGVTARRRLSAMFLPAAGLYGGALVLVCVAVFAVSQFGKSLSRSEPSTGAFVQENLTIADPAEAVLYPKKFTLKDNGSEAAAVLIDDQSAIKNGAAQSKPSSEDSASPVPVETAGAASQFDRPFQPAVSDSSNASAEEPSSDPNDRPLRGASGGVDPAVPDELLPVRKPSAESAGARPEIVLKGAPTGAVSEARSRPMPPAANVVSPEPTSRVPVNPSAAAAVIPSQPNTEAGGAISKTDSDATEAAVSRVAMSVGDPGGSNRASAASVIETNVRDAPPPTVETAALLSRGDTLFETRDIASARLFYEYAANAGDAKAAIRLGETFDPAFLSRAQVKGVRGEPAVALKWYKRAQELGASDAEILIFGLQLK
jgi:hypothetical protein